MISQSFSNVSISCYIIYLILHVILDINCESQYPSVQATISGAALKAVPKLSKNLVAYMLAVCPYVNCPFDSRAKGVAEAVASAALADLNKLANKIYMASLKRTAWQAR